MTTRRILVGLAGVLLVGLIAALGAIPPADPTPAPVKPVAKKIPVKTELLTRVSQLTVKRTYTGTISAQRTSEIGFDRSARVVSILVDEGESVVEGKTLARLDARRLATQRNRIRAQNDEAVALLAELKAGPRRQTIDAARAEVNELSAQVELQRRTHRRTSALQQRGAVSEQQRDDTELGLKSLEAKLDAARKRLDELEAGTRSERVAAQTAVVAGLDAALADIEIEIEDSTLVAPFSGRIARRFIDEGTVVTSSQPVLQLVETGALEAHIGLPVTAFKQLKQGRAFTVVVNGREWTTRFDRVLPEVDLQTRTRVAIFNLPAQAVDNVVPGEIARVSIEEVQPTDGFWLPTTSLVRSIRGLWSAYAIEIEQTDGIARVERREVEVLHTEGNRTLVRGTLQSGERVIISGTHRVVPGQLVAIEK